MNDGAGVVFVTDDVRCGRQRARDLPKHLVLTDDVTCVRECARDLPIGLVVTYDVTCVRECAQDLPKQVANIDRNRGKPTTGADG
jgi:hypothetical protein